MVERVSSSSDSIRQELDALREAVTRQGGQIARLEAAVRDLCELVTLPDDQRVGRRGEQRRAEFERLRVTIKHVVARRRFDALEPLLAEIDRNFAGEHDAEDVKLGAWAARDAALADTLAELREAVRPHIAAADFAAARAAVDAALAWFPAQTEILAVRHQVDHAHAAWTDQTTASLQFNVKAAAEARQWGAALQAAEDLIAQFPNHARAAKLATELPTLRQNAEIERRQRLEQQLHALVRAGRFAEALSLAQEIIDAYPQSLQAAACRALLPRLEAMTVTGEGDGVGQDARG
jgi:tetratricopeptide (TPR) repeat protein